MLDRATVDLPAINGPLTTALGLKANSADLGTASTNATGDFATAAQGSTADSAIQSGDLAAVATSGNYADLSGEPSLGTAAGADSGDFAAALGSDDNYVTDAEKTIIDNLGTISNQAGDQDLATTDDVEFNTITGKAFLQPTAALTSAGAIAWDCATNAQPTLSLAHDTTITLSNLPASTRTVSLAGTQGSGGHSVAIGHTSLAIKIMGGGELADIAGLTDGKLFEISAKSDGTNLKIWVTVEN